jgi:hypothetical protein
MCLALRAASYEELAARVQALVSLEVPAGTWAKVKTLSKLKDLSPVDRNRAQTGKPEVQRAKLSKANFVKLKATVNINEILSPFYARKGESCVSGVGKSLLRIRNIPNCRVLPDRL